MVSHRPAMVALCDRQIAVAPEPRAHVARADTDRAVPA
jgi:hypothetical protein